MLIRIVGLTTVLSMLISSGCSPAPSGPATPTASAPAVQAPQTPPPKPAETRPNPSPASGPSWELVDEPTYNFGRIWTGKTILHPFRIKNVGTETLQLSKPKAHCSCSSPDTYPPSIAPGEVGQIMYRLNLTNKAGDVNEYLEAQTNDPAKPMLRVQMSGFARTVCQQIVTYDLTASEGRMPPERMEKFAELRGDFGRASLTEPLKRVIELRNTSGEKLSLQLPPIIRASVSDNTGKTRVAPPMFDVSVVEKTPGEVWEMTIVGKPPYNTFYNNMSIAFATGLPDYATYEAFAYVYCPPRVEIIPSKIVCNEIAQSRNRRITITNYGDKPFIVKSVACTDPRVALTLQPIDPMKPGVFLIDVILPGDPSYLPPTYGDIIRIETTDPEHAQVEIYILPHLSNPPTPRPADKPIEFHPGTMLGTP